MRSDGRIYEYEIEDYLAKNPGALRNSDGAETLGRQIVLPHGTVDLLIWQWQVLVVELKARELREGDIGQVLRYTHDVRCWIEEIAGDVCCRNDEVNKARQEYTGLSRRAFDDTLTKYFLFHNPDDGWPAVVPVLVGTRSNGGIDAAMIAAGGEVYLWSMGKAGLSFSCPIPCADFRDAYHTPYPNWLSTVASRILYVAHEEARSAQESLVNDLFGTKEA